MAWQDAWAINTSRKRTRDLCPYRVWKGLEICISRYARQIQSNWQSIASRKKILMVKSIISWFTKTREQRRMSAEEKYLAQSVDLCDLERRQRALTYGTAKGFIR